MLTLGFFDGVHRGHQSVIQQGRQAARQQHLPLAVMTFNHHPSLAFRHLTSSENTYLSTLKQKEQLLTQLDVDLLYVIDFTSAFASLTPEAFVAQYIVGLQAKIVVAGFDYTFGNRPAQATELTDYAQQRYQVNIVAQKSSAALKISSSRIRALLAAGDVQQANQLLDYVYTTPALVVHSATAGAVTLQVKPLNRLPAAGEYQAKISFEQHWYDVLIKVPATADHQVQLITSALTVPIFGEEITIAWLNNAQQPQQLPSSTLGAYPTK
ncbi:FAD synthetase family protein [Loigolactobacillus binensis]|uniref:Bifunctional riboflavin kinase/FMN adenylyltransferase n=1 Tax=Loigolactobacillus binensis TaxID=2559922 RepID=A0ABW3EFA2_9LACO|nr:FAD synthetase family protein [Loigolactobacillus binensis]